MLSNIRQKISQKIKSLRQRKGLTQEKLAALAEIEYKYLQRIEGKNPPDIGIVLLGKIAKALKTTPANLLK